ncbi:MAG: hypothetical protein HOP29_10165 [Phycisphaerales bacterium]|nr:hypothetical protein [Phycisphaerales bacterium]
MGKTYSLYAVGEDNVGNVEAAPATPDAVTLVTSLRLPGDVELVDYMLFAQCVYGPDTEVESVCAEADLTTDRRVDLLDFSLLQSGFEQP